MKLLKTIVLCLPAITGIAQDVSVDQKLGEQGMAYVEASMGIYADSVKTTLLSRIGQNLVSHLGSPLFPYQFYIVDAGEPNAFALPGGYVFFTRGILAIANSEDELAGVMGHEIIHSNNRHAIRQRKKGILPGLLQVPGALASALGGEGAAAIFSPLSKGGEAITASHSRKDEYEADEEGIKLSARSGYQPKELAAMLTSLTKSVEVFTGQKEQPSYFNDHPYTPDRVKRITKGSAELQVSSSPRVFQTKRDFMNFLNGVLIGPNPNQGVFKGDWFLHPEMKFKLRIPEVWNRQNSMTAVVGADSTESAILLLELESKAKSALEAANSFASQFHKKTGLELDVVSKKVNGSQASQLSFVNTKSGKKLKVTLLWIEFGESIFRITGGSAPAFESEVASLMESFAPMTLGDHQGITKRIIRVVEPRSGETLQMISERSHNTLPITLTAAINGIPENTVFQEGDLLKVVVEVPYQ